MSFCDHCEGQRFDRAQVLRTLRAVRKTLPRKSRADEALTVAINAVRVMDIPHLEHLDDSVDGQSIH